MTRKRTAILLVFALLLISIGIIFGVLFGGYANVVKLSEVRELVLEKGYTPEAIEEQLKGVSRKKLHMSWGEPDGMLSGLWGEIWFLNEQKDGRITLYYNSEGYVENVVIDTAPGKILPEEEDKLIYGDTSFYGELGLTKDDIIISAKEGILKSPPQMVVTCAEKQITALRGTYSWMYQNGDGTSTGIEADSMHPLECQEYMEALPIGYSTISSRDSFLASFQFVAAPDEMSIQFWNIDEWNHPEAKSEELKVQAIEVAFADGRNATDYQARLLEGNYIYQVIAKWNGREEYGGTAYYSFYTVMGDYKIVPIRK